MTNDNSRWLEARLIESFDAASNVKGLVFDVPGWPGHNAGQHVDIRLTSADGYVAERSYSIANAPGEGDRVELGVELLPDGEVSTYLWQLKPGERIELRGPIGGHFVWDPNVTGKADSNKPLVLVAGGSGMVPLMSMLRTAAKTGKATDLGIIFIISLRALDRLLYADELAGLAKRYPSLKVVVTLTDSAPADWKGYSRRIDVEMFKKEITVLAPSVYICGPTKFVEAAALVLVGMGYAPESIKTERFGG